MISELCKMGLVAVVSGIAITAVVLGVLDTIDSIRDDFFRD